MAAEIITTGTFDGDRLPAISTTKKGAVPATGAPAGHFLKDTTGLFEHIVQADVSGLEVAATPQFAGLGIKTAGGDNRINLIEGAIVGVAAGPYQKYNAAAKLYEMLSGDVNIGNTPTQPGTGGTWSMVYDSDTSIIYKLLEFNGDLYAAGGNGVYRRSAGTWARVLTVGSAYCHTLCVFNLQLYAFFRDSSYIYRTSNGTDWTNVTPVGSPTSISASIVWNGVFYVSAPWGEVWYTTNGTSWTQTMAQADSMLWGRGFAVLGSNLYVAMDGATTGAIYKFNGTTWTRVLLITSNYGFQAICVWNNKLYAGTAYGDIYSSANGTDWSAPVALPAVGNTREFIEYNGKLLANSTDKVYETSDGLTWTLFYDSPETSAYCFALYGTVLFLGTSADGKIYAYTDATYIPAPNLRVFGHSTLWGQFRPGDAPGIKGSLLMSDVPSYNKWLAPGVAKTYIAAPAVAGNDPVYQVIPATDLWATVADKIFGRATAGAGYGEEIACTAFGRSLIDDATAAAAATTLGLGATDSPVFATVKLSGLTDGYMPFHSNDSTGLINSPMLYDGTDFKILRRFVMGSGAAVAIGQNAAGGLDVVVGSGTIALQVWDDNDLVTPRFIVQRGGNVGIGTTGPNANAILDVTSVTKAFMPPRMTTAQRDAIASPTEGMVIFNITTHVLDSYYTSWAAV
ncbi:MAG: hypothetical protein KKC03_14055 [Bacteroidetes bacterium]|nr:hypothetical protein [Bacteroidota bacterium]